MRVAFLLVVERVLLLLLVSFEYCMNEEEEGVHLWSEDDWTDEVWNHNRKYDGNKRRRQQTTTTTSGWVAIEVIHVWRGGEV